MNLLLVATGGALGSVIRYLVASFIGQNANFPFATLVINVSGSFLMGILIGILARSLPYNSGDIRLFLAVGVLGGYTTFSTFSLDAIVLMENGKLAQMLLYILSSVILSLLGVMAGLFIARIF